MGKTNYHAYLEKRFVVTRVGSGHWIPRSGTNLAVRLPDGMGCTSLKRAVYAAYKGDIPGGMKLQSWCGVKGCLRPDHQNLVKAAGKNQPKPLSLSKHLDAKLNRGYVPLEPLEKLPSNITLIIYSKALRAKGSMSLGEVRLLTGLSSQEIMMIWSGRYSRAVENEERRLESLRKKKEDEDESPVKEAAFAKKELPKNLTPEEAAWLKTVS